MGLYGVGRKGTDALMHDNTLYKIGFICASTGSCYVIKGKPMRVCQQAPTVL